MIDCGSAGLDDAKMSQLLQLFINNPAVSPLTLVYLAYNRLTKIPNEIAQLNQLDSVYLQGNNIRSIQSNAFNSSSTLRVLHFAPNHKDVGSVSLIAPGAFNFGKYKKYLKFNLKYCNKTTTLFPYNEQEITAVGHEYD